MHTRCEDCHRPLKDPDSRARGKGPVCARKGGIRAAPRIRRPRPIHADQIPLDFPAAQKGHTVANKIANRPSDVHAILLDRLNHYPVRITKITAPQRLTDPMAIINSQSPAYSVEIIPTVTHVTVVRNGRFGFHEQMTYVDYPAPADDPTFDDRLTDALRPIIEQELWLAAEHRHLDHQKHGENASYEAAEAVTPLT